MRPEEAQVIADGLVRCSPDAAFRRGLDLLKADYPETLLPALKRLWERKRTNPRLAQLLGLAARAAGDGPLAYTAFSRAARLAPTDPLIAHSHARTALEAGKPAVDLFERAVSLAPQDGSVLLGLAAALVAERHGQEAIERLEAILTRNPLWIDGHRTLAHIRGQLGIDPVAHINATLATLGARNELHRLHILTLFEARRYSDAAAAVAEARAMLGDLNWLRQFAAHAASEMGDIDAAENELAAAPLPASQEEFAMHARHLLRAGRPAEAAELLEPRVAEDRDHIYWSYLSLAWRLLDDPRADWLEGDESLVGLYDLGDQVGDLEALATDLRHLHVAAEAPLDQSVRGGTQSDGNLLLRDTPRIQRLRKALLGAVARHVERLPPTRQGHPTLLSRRAPQRIAGSWSVRLREAGFHADHVHSQGWLSSAFYVALPETLPRDDPADLMRKDGGTHEGWLTLGECHDLVPDLAPTRLIEPRPGRLVLFPSTMWHGTRPFSAGERLTVAFDIALPRQETDQ